MKSVYSKGWEVDDNGNTIFVTPVKDIRPHIQSINCPCNPNLSIRGDGVPILTHNSFDGRENFEHDNKIRHN